MGKKKLKKELKEIKYILGGIGFHLVQIERLMCDDVEDLFPAELPLRFKVVEKEKGD